VTKGIFGARNFIIRPESLRITKNYLQEETHANLDHLFEPCNEGSLFRGNVNVLKSVGATVLHRSHPSNKDYSQWTLESIDLFRGNNKDGTTLTHLDILDEHSPEYEISALTFVYFSILGSMMTTHHSTEQIRSLKSNDKPLDKDIVLTEGEGIVIFDPPIDHAIHINSNSVVARLAFQ